MSLLSPAVNHWTTLLNFISKFAFFKSLPFLYFHYKYNSAYHPTSTNIFYWLAYYLYPVASRFPIWIANTSQWRIHTVHKYLAWQFVAIPAAGHLQFYSICRNATGLRHATRYVGTETDYSHQRISLWGELSNQSDCGGQRWWRSKS